MGTALRVQIRLGRANGGMRTISRRDSHVAGREARYVQRHCGSPSLLAGTATAPALAKSLSCTTPRVNPSCEKAREPDPTERLGPKRTNNHDKCIQVGLPLSLSCTLQAIRTTAAMGGLQSKPSDRACVDNLRMGRQLGLEPFQAVMEGSPRQRRTCFAAIL